MAWRMALLGNTMAHGGQTSVETHKGGSTGHPLTKNGASGWLCRRPALPSAVGSIGIEPTADGPWRRLSGAQLGPWAHPSRPKSEKKRSSRFRFFRCSWAIPRLLNSDAKGGIERRGHPVSKSQKNLDFFFRRPADTRQARGAKPPK